MKHEDSTTQEKMLRNAAVAGDTAQVSALLSSGAQLDACDHAALRWAIRHKQLGVARLLIDAGTPLDKYADEFLSIAVKNGDSEMLTLLLDCSPPPHSPKVIKEWVCEAVNKQAFGVVEELILREPVSEYVKDLAFVLAGANGDVSLMAFLLRNGSDINALSCQALYNAVLFAKSVKAVKFLLAHGIDLKLLRGCPLELAIMDGHTEMVEVLLDAGLPLNFAAVEFAANRDSLETLLILQGRGANICEYLDGIIEKAYNAPRILQYALEKGNVSKAILNETLEKAAESNCYEAAELLVQHGADPSAQDSAALRGAIEACNFRIASFLLSAGAKARDLDLEIINHILEKPEPEVRGDWSSSLFWPEGHLHPGADLIADLLEKNFKLEEAEISPRAAARFIQAVDPPVFYGYVQSRPAVRDALVALSRELVNKAGDEIRKSGVGDLSIVAKWLAAVMACQSAPITESPKPKLDSAG